MKRVNNKNKKQNRTKLFILVIAVICVLSIIIIGKSSVSAETINETETFYTSISVESGDTLSEIAAEYDISVKELKKMNNLKSNTIYAGENLIVSYSKSAY